MKLVKLKKTTNEFSPSALKIYYVHLDYIEANFIWSFLQQQLRMSNLTLTFKYNSAFKKWLQYFLQPK